MATRNGGHDEGGGSRLWRGFQNLIFGDESG